MLAKPKAKTYQQLTDELTAILEWFESDKVQLEPAMAKYQEALDTIAQLEKLLKIADNKIRKLTAG